MPVPSKVIYGGTTLIDLTEDSVTPETLAFGATAHSASGEQIVGTADVQTDSGLLSIEDTTVFSGSIKYRKVGKVVEINAHQITLVDSVPAGDYVELGTIPSGFRPQAGVYPASVPGATRQIGTGFNLTAYNRGSSYTNPFVVEIDSSGVIVLYATTNAVYTTDSINISMMYFTD